MLKIQFNADYLLYQFNATARKYIEIVYLAKDMDDNLAGLGVLVIGSGIID